MIYRFFSTTLILCFFVSTTSSYADVKTTSANTIGAATTHTHGNDAKQMLGKTFDLLITAFKTGHPDARAKLCELRAKSYDNGNIILVKKIEEHRYKNSYECDETAKEQSKTTNKDEQKRHVANTPQIAEKNEEQERKAITITEQKLAAALREKQEREAAYVARMASEKIEQERLAAEKAKEEKVAAAKAAKEQQIKEKAAQERIAAEATRQAEEKLERERLIAAITEEERAIAVKAEQERIAAAKAAKNRLEKEQIKQAQLAAEEARLATEKQERERIATAEAQEKKNAAAKAVTDAANTSKERLMKEKAMQIQAATKAAQSTAEKQEHEHIAPVTKEAAKAVANKPESKQHVAVNSKPDTTQNLPKPGQSLPSLSVISFSGMPVSADYYRGSVLVIDFFAPWCQTCRRHITKLLDLQNKFRKQGLQVLGLNVDNAGKDAVTNFTTEMQMTYLVAQADETIQARFGVRSVPTVYIVDKKGRIAEVFRNINSETDRTIDSLVKKLLSDE